MTSILCLAHYCDVHGPTPLMVTEGLPVPCSVCYEHEAPLPAVTSTSDDRPRSNAPAGSQQATAAVTESLRRLGLAGGHRSASVPASEHDVQTHRAALLRAAQLAEPGGASALESPPESPGARRFSDQLPAQPKRSESGFKKTYDDYVTRRAAACDNCALTLPRRQESPNGDKSMDARSALGPTLRTRAPCARVYSGASDGGAPDDSPLDSQASSSAASEDETHHPRRPSHRRTASRSTASTSSAAHAHTHYLDYTSTHEPVTPQSFSIVRASCLRTLSFENLPRTPVTTFGQPASMAPSPMSTPATPAFVTTHSAGSAASGGPIFFGDPAAGYTTAYIFRIPDMHARGHRRLYAFLALSTHRESLAMKSFGFVAAAFRDLAAWIQRLAESEAERGAGSPSSAGPGNSSPIVGAGPGFGGFGSSDMTPGSGQTAVGSGASGGGSSFLTGGTGGLSRRMGAGFGGANLSLKQRGLAELVGMPDFFIELHTRFVRLLLELAVELGS